MNLIDAIKTAGIQAMDSKSPVNILQGEVVTIDPISVKVDQSFTLTGDFLIVPESLVRYEINLVHTHKYQDQSESGNITRTSEDALRNPVVIRGGLSAGDKVK